MLVSTIQGQRVGTLATDGCRAVVCEVQGHTQVCSRRSGELYRLHTEEWSTDALIDGEILFLVGGRTGTLRAFGLVDGVARPCPSATGVSALRRWGALDAPAEHGLVASHFDGRLRTYDAEHRPMAELGLAAQLEAFDVRGTTVFAAYEGQPLRAYDARTGELRYATSDVLAEPVLCVHADAAGVVTTSLDDGVRVYDPELRLARTTHGLGLVGRLCADPRDARVLHAVGPERVLRLERDSLEILDEVRALSSHQAFCVDALGRLVGVEGGVDALDPMPPPPPPDPEVPDVEARYDRDATFDKDIPGMCATRVEIWQKGRRVTVCSWYHEEGSRKGDTRVQRGTLERVEGDLVHVAMDDGATARFDLTTRRLV